MKKTRLLHPELSYVISSLGHGDKIVIADAGLPVPKPVDRIDLALSQGIPSFMSVLEAVLSEMHVESATLADELKLNVDVYNMIVEKLAAAQSQAIQVHSCKHEQFKKLTEGAICIIRTGEFTAYSNVILSAGVVF